MEGKEGSGSGKGGKAGERTGGWEVREGRG